VAGTSAPFPRPSGGHDAAGNIYISFLMANQVYKRDTAGQMTLIAGLSAAASSTGDGAPARNATLNGPAGLAVDPATGALYVAEYFGTRCAVSTRAGLSRPSPAPAFRVSTASRGRRI